MYGDGDARSSTVTTGKGNCSNADSVDDSTAGMGSHLIG